MGGRETEKHLSVAEVRALTRDRTCSLLVYGMMLLPRDHTGQGCNTVLNGSLACYGMGVP